MQILVCETGIDNKMEYEITNLIKATFEQKNDNQVRVRYISDYLDKVYGGCWRVIIGKDFRTSGIYFCQQFLRIIYCEEFIEVFKTQGDVAFEIIHKDPKISPQVEDSIIQCINSAQNLYYDIQQHSEYICACMEAKFQGRWAVIAG